MDIKGIMRQAQQMQEKMKKIEAELANKEYEGSAGGGLVKITLNGNGSANKVFIDSSLLIKEEKEILEDLIIAGINDAKKKSEEGSSEALKSVTAGMPLPPGFKI